MPIFRKRQFQLRTIMQIRRFTKVIDSGVFIFVVFLHGPTAVCQLSEDTFDLDASCRKQQYAYNEPIRQVPALIPAVS